MAQELLQPDAIVGADTIRIGAVLSIEGDRVKQVFAPGMAPKGARRIHGTLLPGFVDLQVNGAMGRSVDEASIEALDAIAAAVLQGGAQAFCPTLITAPFDQLCEQVAAVAAWIDLWHQRPLEQRQQTAMPLGLHIEGPFLDNEGTHDRDAFVPPTPQRVAELLRAGAGRLRLLTLSPGTVGSAAAVRQLVAAGVTVALGHASSAVGAALCIEAGATLGTHLWNGMGPSHHRRPGLADVVLDDERLAASLICDGVHVHPMRVRQAFACLGPGRLVLVTDSVAAAGMPDGDYRLAGQTVTRRGNEVRNQQGGLAGSCLTMAEAAENFLAFVDRAGAMSLARVAAINPARLVFADGMGQIAPGALARFQCLDASNRLRSLSAPY